MLTIEEEDTEELILDEDDHPKANEKEEQNNTAVEDNSSPADNNKSLLLCKPAGLHDTKNKQLPEVRNWSCTWIQREREDSDKSSNGESQYVSNKLDCSKEEASSEFFDREASLALYNKFQKLEEKHIDPVMVKQLFHSWSMQKKESMNQAVSIIAPKDLTFSTMASLEYQVTLVIGINLVGW